MFRVFVITTALGIVLACESISLAQAESAAIFARLDLNQDGQLTKAEINSSQMAYFERLLRTSDQNQDQMINKNEFLQGTQPQQPLSNSQAGFDRAARFRNLKPENIFRALDKDRDGQLTRAEVPPQAPLYQLFEVVGKNQFSLEEFQQIAKRYQPTTAESSMSPPVMDEPMAMNPINSPAWRTLDRNDDGKITTIEMELAPLRLLALDKNKDGKLTADEWQ